MFTECLKSQLRVLFGGPLKHFRCMETAFAAKFARWYEHGGGTSSEIEIEVAGVVFRPGFWLLILGLASGDEG